MSACVVGRSRARVCDRQRKTESTFCLHHPVDLPLETLQPEGPHKRRNFSVPEGIQNRHIPF